jgi:hypothetical protein
MLSGHIIWYQSQVSILGPVGYGQTSTSTEHELTKRALESYPRKCIHEWFKPQTPTTHDLSMRAHRHFAKVTSFYIGCNARTFELWLLFECFLVSLVLLIGFMRSKGPFTSYQAICKNVHQLPLHDDEKLSSRTTPFQEGGADTGWLADTTTSSTSCTSPTTHGLKAEVTEAWKRRRNEKSARIDADRYYRPHDRYYRP